jgi:TRC40/GET3/ArsA family transport-energizing ATPase
MATRSAPAMSTRSFNAAAAAATGAGGEQSLARFATKDGSRRFIFIGGKGGVGKTTTSAALSLRLAQSGLRTLCVSTDPAHSLGDVFGAKLGATPVAVECGGHPLYAMEVDPDVAITKWQNNMNIDRVRALLAENRAGFGAGVLGAISSIPGVNADQFLKILETVPPGLDEVVALGEIMKVVEDAPDKGFDRIIVDTAPTGHTLRLLDLPMFLHQFTDLILKTGTALPSVVVKPLSGLMSTLGGTGSISDQLSITGQSMCQFRQSMEKLNKVQMLF